MALEVYKCFWYGVAYAFPIPIVFGLFYVVKRAFTASAEFDNNEN